jgi:hypothetical protein
MKGALLVLVSAALLVPASQARVAGGSHVALVTAETLNELVAVSLPSGRILKRLHMPVDPQNVEAYAGAAVVVSTRGGSVTLVDPRSLRVRKVIRGFGAPHIAAFSPDGDYIYVTDDERGQVAVILGRLIRKVFVGRGESVRRPLRSWTRIEKQAELLGRGSSGTSIQEALPTTSRSLLTGATSG